MAKKLGTEPCPPGRFWTFSLGLYKDDGVELIVSEFCRPCILKACCILHKFCMKLQDMGAANADADAALSRTLDGASLKALVPNAGPLNCRGKWTLVLEQALTVLCTQQHWT